jgi:RING-like zinc finger
MMNKSTFHSSRSTATTTSVRRQQSSGGGRGRGGVVERRRRGRRCSLLRLPLQGMLLVFCMMVFSSTTYCTAQSTSSSSQYFYFCDLSRQPVVILYWNDTTMEYQEEDNTRSSNTTEQGKLRHLLQQQQRHQQSQKDELQEQQHLLSWNDVDLNSLLGATMYPASSIRRFAEEENTTGTTIVTGNTTDVDHSRPLTIAVRICPCAESHPAYPDHKYYCQTDRSYCAVPGAYPPAQTTNADGTTGYAVITPVCLNLQNDEIFVRSVWPIILIWFALALVFCLCTYPGRNAIDYVIATLFPCYNKRVVDSILLQSSSASRINNSDNALSPVSRHAYQRRRHLEERYRYLVREQRVVDGGLELAERRVFEYQLKTRRYRRPAVPKNGDGDGGDENDKRASAAPELDHVSSVNTTRRTAAAAAQPPTSTVEMTRQPAEAPLPASSSSPSSLLEANNNIDENDSINNDDNDNSNEEADELEHACSICFVPLENGDRVGALPCQHVFHVGKSTTNTTLLLSFILFTNSLILTFFRFTILSALRA